MDTVSDYEETAVKILLSCMTSFLLLSKNLLQMNKIIFLKSYIAAYNAEKHYNLATGQYLCLIENV